MARIPLVWEDDPATPEAARDVLTRVQRGSGEVFNGMRLAANHPRAANALLDFLRVVRTDNHLTRTQSELAWTTASVVNACHY
jgi:hypothetical protein